MTLNIALIILGLLLVVFGADGLIEGASAVARKLGVSEFVIGVILFLGMVPTMVPNEVQVTRQQRHHHGVH